ncbi:hypothetical protein [Arthrobacter sp. UCD-GKA]|uniref:hypothetical protein n=1 Tax=Arthrobacter sp. UCD-GKA TaxID=1913576 RepID=UPI00257109AC|nr:hypothetical protein [Arthrobacter sp. UCD-GKA]
MTYLQARLDDRIERRAKSGAKDRGDLSGWRHQGMRVVAELKNVAKLNLAGWITEAETERMNDDAQIGLVIHKRVGKGPAQMGETYVTLTLDNLLVIMGAGKTPAD